MKKKVLSVLLAVLMALGAMPPGAVQAAEIVASGECGAQGGNVTWALDSEGTLTISGTGEMKSFTSKDQPWKAFMTDNDSSVVIRQVIIQDGITDIGAYAFEKSVYLETLSIPDSVIEIHTQAFQSTGLTSVDIPSGVTYIGMSAFSSCKNMSYLYLPDTITYLGQYAFSNCTNLLQLTIPVGITKIPYQAFRNCCSLTHLVLPTGLVEIEDYAFRDCNNLKQVEIPEGVTHIGTNAFVGCNRLAEVFLPKSLKNVGTVPFEGLMDGAHTIKDVYYGGTEAEWNMLPYSLRNDFKNFNSTIHYNATGLPGGVVTPTPTPTPSPSPKPTLGPLPHPTPDGMIPDDADASGTCGAQGDNLVWWVKDGTLTIAGEGEMADYDFPSKNLTPWMPHATGIHKVVVEKGVTTIGRSAFSRLPANQDIALGEDIVHISRGGLAANEPTTIHFKGSPPVEIDAAAFGHGPTVYFHSAIDLDKSGWAEWTGKKYFAFDDSRPEYINTNSQIYPRWVKAVSKLPGQGTLRTGNTWCFANTSRYWGDEKVGYYITQSDYDKIKSSSTLSGTEKTSMTKSKASANPETDWAMRKTNFNVEGKGTGTTYEEHWGSCYGMSALAAAVWNGAFPCTALAGTPTSLFSIDQDALQLSTKISKQTQSAINFYHMQQNLKAVQDKKFSFGALPQSAQLSTLESEVKAAEENNRVVLIDFDFKWNGHSTGHTVVGYGVEEGRFPMELNGKSYVFTHRILIYDPVVEGGSQKPYDDSLYYNGFYEGSQWAIPYWESDGERAAVSSATGLDINDPANNAQLTGILTDDSYINAVDYRTGERHYSKNQRSASTPGYIYTSSQDLDLTIGGQAVRIRGGLFDGSTTVSGTGARILFPKNGDGSGAYTIALPEGAAYTVSAKGGFACSLETDEYYMDVAADKGGAASFTPGGKVTLELAAPGSGCLGVTANDSPIPWHNFSLSGEGVSHLEAELTDKGLLVSGDLEKAETAAYEDEDDPRQLKFSTKEGSVLVTEQGGDMALRADKDGDGDYTDPVDGSPSGPSEFTVFTDVAPTAWYAEAVEYVYTNGIMNGTSSDRFAPNSTTNRGMVVTVLHRMQGAPAPSPAGPKFSDVPSGQWYSNAVAWAAGEGVVKGMGQGRFAPGNPITREQLAVILYNYAGLDGADTTQKADYSSFPDSASVSGWAQDAIGWAVGAGLVNGKGGRLVPKGTASRAEIATILMRYSQMG